ncbi:MAG: HAMP domain-containing histidine kinase [Candidatus Rokubacteria bacterium]|nr:HAMP domain-containing histidine kinase [Candidatus Rokubacteria bacterium]
MRLASKIFLSLSLIVLVLVAVAVLSLRAIDRLADVNREISTETVPALRLVASARDAVLALGRLEARYLVLRDAQYAALWEERASRATADLDVLRGFATSRGEAAYLADARAGFDEYRRVVAEGRTLLRAGDRQTALRLAETRGQQLIQRIETNLESLAQARHATVIRAQASAARLESRTWTGVLVALAAAVGLALLSTAVLAHRMTRSLSRLSAATSSVAAGSFREPIPVEGGDEIGDLARSFNQMAARLRQMDETKEELFARISHELRSPLTSVREAAHLLREGIPGSLNSKQARLVDIIGTSSDRLLRLVNQLLELSRIRAGLLPMVWQRVDLDRLVARVFEELRPQADEAGVALARERVGADVTCMGDEDRLIQVVVNLVGNAIRFTSAGGAVTVRLVDAGREVEIRVEDTGVGIPAAALPTIFESYQQAHRNRGGTGLGLAIVRGMIDAHGGRITVESEEGKGSRFTIVLPRERARA